MLQKYFPPNLKLNFSFTGSHRSGLDGGVPYYGLGTPVRSWLLDQTRKTGPGYGPDQLGRAGPRPGR